MHDVFTTRYTLDKVISVGWQQYVKNFTNILVIVFLVYLPINAILSFFSVPEAIYTQNYDQYALAVRVTQFLQLFVAVFATISVTKIVEASLQGANMTWQQALKYASSRWGAVLLTSLTGGVIIFGLSLLLLVPGIIWAVYYSFAIYVATLRGLSGKAALDYSKRIVKGQWWRVVGYSLVLGLIAFLIGIVYGLLLVILPDRTVLTILTDTLASLFDMLFFCMSVVFFLNNDSRGAASEIVEPTYEEPALVPPQEL